MLYGGNLGGLEIRAEGGAVRLIGTFPYGREAMLGAGRAEVIAARAFTVGPELHLLVGHDFDRPLASREAGTLAVRNGDDALEVTATIPAELRAISWVADLLAAHAAGLVRGLSPGFRVAPNGERVERRAGGLLRTVTAAELVEMSAVTRPAYDGAMVEARNWRTGRSGGRTVGDVGLGHDMAAERFRASTAVLRRWRA